MAKRKHTLPSLFPFFLPLLLQYLAAKHARTLARSLSFSLSQLSRCYIGLCQQLHLPVKALVFEPANSIPDPTIQVAPSRGLTVKDSSSRY
jgi:hypothetical protein